MRNPSDRDIPPSRLDRSTCIFPPSSADPTATGRRTVKAGRSRESHQSTSIPTKYVGPATLQAAWALTLQCFIVADVLCFGYNGPSNVNQASSALAVHDFAALYVVRLDRGELVHSFITRLEQHQQLSDPTKLRAGFEISLVDGASSHHQFNTSICFHTGPEGHDASVLRHSSHQKVRSDASNITGGTNNSEADLRLVVTSTAVDEVAIELDYHLSHTHEYTAASVLNTFQHILVQITNPDDTLLIQDVDLCPPFDRKQIQDFTSNVSSVNKECLHELILKQCRQRPQEIAIRSWDGDMTYGELDNLSGRLAGHLVELGVRPEVFVLSCFEKSTWAIVARLAILRAGGAYISIHASNPPVYLESVIKRTKTTILVTDSNFAEQFRHVVPTLVELSPRWLRSLPEQPDLSICTGVQADNACLVLFTSGSTGTPKGIVQIHSSYATAILDYAQNLHLGSHTRFLQFDDYAFDISNLEFLVPLVLGGVCCVPSPVKVVGDLATQIRILEANTIFLTPTVAIRLEPADVRCLDTICVGGEPLPIDLIHKWAAHSTRLVNQYGMGEVAICCAYNDHVDKYEGATIGRPSSGAIWIVDPGSPERLLPIGAVGELIIEGPHLSRGYLDSTALQRTEAGFLKRAPHWLGELHPNRSPFRMYRSGDLGRLNADGTVTYLGRKDTILKIDGCRVDALEVEHQARKFLSDTDTVIVDLLGIINGQADPTLTAFLYLDDHPLSTLAAPNRLPTLIDAMGDPSLKTKVEEIQNGIGLTLPRYMIPTTFVLMTWVPRTASKKIDRKRIHLLGQGFYSGILAERTKDIDYAQRMKVLPM